MQAGLRQGLHDLGYSEGQHYVIEQRSGEGKFEPLLGLAAELVRLPVDVLVTMGIGGTLAARDATTTIPIVFIAVREPVEHGLVASLARPGGNLTGVTNADQDFLSGKSLEVLKEVAPAATRIGLLSNPDHPFFAVTLKTLQQAAQALGVSLHLVTVHDSATELERAFATFAHEQVEALFIGSNLELVSYRTRIVELVAKSRLPAFYGDESFVEAGGLLSYQADETSLARRAGNLVGKILQGAKPADLPVEQPMKYNLAINLKTAKALGITIPPSLLLLADKVIQ